MLENAQNWRKKLFERNRIRSVVILSNFQPNRRTLKIFFWAHVGTLGGKGLRFLQRYQLYIGSNFTSFREAVLR